MELPGKSSKHRDFQLERILFFSDAVFAIAITLLVLGIEVPEASAAELPVRLLELRPKYFGYVISFLVIAVFWMGHHRLFAHIERYNGNLIRLNMAFLMFIAFLPFPNDMIGEYGDDRFVIIFYAVVLTVTGFLSSSLWIYAKRANLVADDLDPRISRYLTARGLCVPAVFLVSIGISLFSPFWAMLSWVLIYFFQRLAGRVYGGDPYVA